jgi:hypothetical protein
MMWTTRFAKLVAAWEVVFGIGGIVGRLSEGMGGEGAASMIDVAAGVLLFGMSAGAGAWLWIRGSGGAWPSIAVQVLQSVPFGYHGFAFRFVAGPHWTLAVGSPPLWAPFGLQAALYWFSQPTLPERWMGVNLVAVATAVFLAISWHQARRIRPCDAA